MIVQTCPELFSLLMQLDQPTEAPSDALARALILNPVNDRSLRSDQINTQTERHIVL